MRILLVGEFSRLHNSLKKALQELGHEVVLIGDGDSFKNYPVDTSLAANFLNRYFLLRKFKNALFRFTSINLEHYEIYFRFLKVKKSLKNFDVVQFIHGNALKLPLNLQLKQMQYLHKHNKKLFLLVCGNDYRTVKFLQKKTLKYSVLTPLFTNEVKKKAYQSLLPYGEKKYEAYYLKIERLMHGLIASDIDYFLVIKNHKKSLGMLPNPVIIPRNKLVKPSKKIQLFLGINQSTKIRKGIGFFEKALEVIAKKYPKQVEITIVENIPYREYIKLYQNCHIFLDMVYAYDQGYNALEAMAQEKVVFTGAEKEFLDYYALQEDQVCINALPDVNYLVEKMSWLIENPYKIEEIGKNAQQFVEREHHFLKIGKKYLNTWEG